MFPDRCGPAVIRPGTQNGDLATLMGGSERWLDAQLAEHGALLFRGFDMSTAADFERVVEALPYDKLDYVYRSTPRTAIGHNVYTATEYPPDLSIPMHNENSYQRRWPNKILFFCQRRAESGGETPIADLQRVNASIGKHLLDEFESRRVQYVRHYHRHIDLPWQTVFQCNDRDELARVCIEHDIQHEWLNSDTLRTTQICQGVAYHPVTKQRVFFNQAHLFHASSLGAEDHRALIELVGRDRLPRHARFGDRGEIGSEQLEAVHSAFKKESVTFGWKSGDVLLLDNMRFAHGREPYKGDRKVLVALLDPSAADRRSLRAI